MKSMSLIAAVAVLSAAVLNGCATNPSTAVPTASSVKVKLVASTISAGMGTTVTAEASLSDGSTSDVTTLAVWSLSDSTVALLACTQTPCPVTATAAGTATLTAAFGGQSGTAMLTVSAATLTSIAVVSSAESVAVGESVNCSAIATLSDGSQEDITGPAAAADGNTATWSSSNAATATVSASGVVTAVATGPVTITASVGALTATADLTVTAAAPVSLSLSPTPANVPKGANLQMTATATLSDGTTTDATAAAVWTSDNTTVALVSTGGQVLPQGTGTANITATLGSITATELVTVIAPQVTSVAITPAPGSVAAGLTLQLGATGTFTDTSQSDVSAQAVWSSSDMTIATVSATGLVTGVAQGMVTITAAVGAVTSTDVITVGAPVPISLSISAPSTTIPLGSSEQLTATATLSDTTMANVTSAAVWTNAPAGKVTGLTQGTVTVTATDGLAMASIMITVGPAVPTSVTVTAPQSTIPAGLAVQFDATAMFTDQTNPDVTSSATWSSSDTNQTVATVDSTTGIVTTVGPGTATITASLDGKSGTFELTVSTTITSVAVTPATVTLVAGNTQQLAVNATLFDSSTLDVTSLATWSTDDAANDIATVSASGLVTAVASSATVVNVTANVSGSMGVSQITVN